MSENSFTSANGSVSWYDQMPGRLKLIYFDEDYLFKNSLAK